MASAAMSDAGGELKQTTNNVEPSKGDHSEAAGDSKGDNEDDIVVVSMSDVPREDNAVGATNAVMNETEKAKDIHVAGAGDLAARENTSDVTAESPETVSDKTDLGTDGSGDTSKTEGKTEGDDEWEDVLGNSLLRKKVLPGPEVIKLFSCSAQLRLKFILHINVKMPTVVGMLAF